MQKDFKKVIKTFTTYKAAKKYVEYLRLSDPNIGQLTLTCDFGKSIFTVGVMEK